jgi:hypothetical protein
VDYFLAPPREVVHAGARVDVDGGRQERREPAGTAPQTSPAQDARLAQLCRQSQARTGEQVQQQVEAVAFLVDAQREELAADLPYPVEPWQERPRGFVPTADLAGLIESESAKLAQAQDKARAAQAAAQELAAVVGGEQAPAAARIAADRDQVDAAGRFDVRAASLRAQADELQHRQREMYAENRPQISEADGLRAKAWKSSKITFQSGRLRRKADALRQQVEERTTRIHELAGQERELRSQAYDQEQQATGIRTRLGVKSTESDSAFLQRRTSGWEREDLTELGKLQKDSTLWAKACGRGEKAVTELRAEAALRSTLTPREERTEQRERTRATLDKAREQLQQEAANHEARLANAYRQQDPHRFQPPDLGHGSPGISR